MGFSPPGMILCKLVHFSMHLLPLLSYPAVASASRSLHEGDHQEWILAYMPVTRVTDHAALDLDQREMEDQLLGGTGESFIKALTVYQEGGNSESYARVQLDDELVIAVAEGTRVVGVSLNNEEVRGTVYSLAAANQKFLEIRYDTHNHQSEYVDCQVGGNPEANIEGCFVAEGSIDVDELGSLEYTYQPRSMNHNGRTLQLLSHDAKDLMYTCPITHGCPMAEYDVFWEYYGVYDYADKWIIAAFNSGDTNFEKGNADFGLIGLKGRREAIRKATVCMSVFMTVIHRMTTAVFECKNDCGEEGCFSEPIHNWDQAVAFYVGSVSRLTGKGGLFLWTLAETRCSNFGTCNGEGGAAITNIEIMKEFNRGKQELLDRECGAAEETKNRIVDLMKVPLVQSALRSAHFLDKQMDIREETKAEAAVFAASVLPFVHRCSEEDAATIYKNLMIGASEVDYQEVRNAFESNYDCLRVSCASIGGLLDPIDGSYIEGAEPCGSYTVPHSQPEEPESESDHNEVEESNKKRKITLTVVFLVFGLLIFSVLITRGSRRDMKEFDGMSEDPPNFA